MLDRFRIATVFFACIAAPLAAAASAVPEIALQPIADDVLHGCDAHRLDAAVRDRLARGKRFHLAAKAENAALTFEITNCTQRDRAHVTSGTKGGPVFGPSGGGGMARGTETETGMGISSTRQIVLEARVSAGGRFLTVSALAKDRNLREALDSVRKKLDRALEEKGDWLLGTSP